MNNAANKDKAVERLMFCWSKTGLADCGTLSTPVFWSDVRNPAKRQKVIVVSDRPLEPGLVLADEWGVARNDKGAVVEVVKTQYNDWAVASCRRREGYDRIYGCEVWFLVLERVK